jgi:NAD(P)-dependent dehydrogenase (short-subunit alcohol dehydrogenase family)
LKNTIIIGGTSGLGLALSEEFKLQGDHVFSVGRLKHSLSQNLDSITWLKADLLIPDDKTKVFNAIDGLEQIDLFIYNIGGSFGLYDEFKNLQNHKQIFELNYFLAVEFVNRYVEKIKKAPSGKIIFLLSQSCINYAGNTPYVAAKCALMGYMKSIAAELSTSGVVVSGVAPGALDYDHRYLGKLKEANGKEWVAYRKKYLPSGRLVRIEEVVAAVAYLASDLSSHNFGTIVDIAG